jgi:hypothetical protein
MFGILKLIILMCFLGGGFFVYDFFSHLEAKERLEVKEDIKKLLDSGQVGVFWSSFGGKMSEDFHNRFWPKVTKAFD